MSDYLEPSAEGGESMSDLYRFMDWGNEFFRADNSLAKMAIEGIVNDPPVKLGDTRQNYTNLID